jgi:Tfp pilus assembly protein PilF
MTKNRKIDPEAYEAYLQGRHFYERTTPEGLNKAEEFFQRALAIDPSFAAAHVGLADVYGIKAYALENASDYATKQEESARRAISLDPTDGSAHALLGDALRYFRWDWPGAEAAYRRGIDLTPNDVLIRRKLWALLVSLGRFAEASPQLELARRLDPLAAAIPSDASHQALMQNDLDRATIEANRALELDPAYPPAHAAIWFVRHQRGDNKTERDESLTSFLRGMGYRETADEFQASSELATYETRLLRAARALEERSLRERVPVGVGGGLYVAAGDLDRAEAWLLRAYRERSPEMTWLGQNPSWRALRSRPAIAALLKELDLMAP